MISDCETPCEPPCETHEKEEALKAVMGLMGDIIADLVADGGDAVLIEIEGVPLELEPGEDGPTIAVKCATVAAVAFARRNLDSQAMPAGAVLQ